MLLPQPPTMISLQEVGCHCPQALHRPIHTLPQGMKPQEFGGRGRYVDDGRRIGGTRVESMVQGLDIAEQFGHDFLTAFSEASLSREGDSGRL